MTTARTDRTGAEALPADGHIELVVVAWRDGLVEAQPGSHPTAANDTLVWWTPVLGPTATLMAHRFAGHVANGQQRTFTLGELASTFGVGQSNGRIRAALMRLERFGVIEVTGHTVAVRLALCAPTARHLEQLPAYLADLYQQRRRRTVGASTQP